ncbi:MAG: serine/threonine-protein kinase [Jaaginema sp. PMC 1079.18]|nr:serine/threonine-protein kinase [Jaaginema sp. PMC 1080.18]MEC4850154.1 serine/threonine-protein kinase [Jaaginema sp. PMC 1079.18]MEC4866061.1 serine/threonine-protein kinase [Jaaginema sp. PMC 1078.18]
MTVTAAIASGTLINQRYRIAEAIASGGFGRTYLAGDECQNQLCLLKEFSCDPHNSTLSQQSRAFFEREAAILQRLSHPQIPRFLGTFESEGRLFLVQEYIEGQTYQAILQNRQARQQTLGEGEIIRWLRSLLPVLDYLHRCGIVHCDISPDNIMQPRRGSPLMLIDFGVAMLLEGNSPPATAGKFGYAPPEQLAQGQCYPHSDLYALGATALVLLTGKLPSQLYNTQQQRWQWRRWCKVSPHLARVLDRMVAAKPNQRWQTAAAVLAALPPEPRRDLPQEWQEPLPPPRYDYRRIAIAIILLCLGMAAITVFASTIPAFCQPLGWCDRDPTPPSSQAARTSSRKNPSQREQPTRNPASLSQKLVEWQTVG